MLNCLSCYLGRKRTSIYVSDGEVTCLNRKPGLRLESGGVEDAELLVYLVNEKNDVYIGHEGQKEGSRYFAVHPECTANS